MTRKGKRGPTREERQDGLEPTGKLARLPYVKVAQIALKLNDEKYPELNEYVATIKKNLLIELGEISQIEMIVLDTALEALMLSKFVCAEIFQTPGKLLKSESKAITYAHTSYNTMFDRKLKLLLSVNKALNGISGKNSTIQDDALHAVIEAANRKD